MPLVRETALTPDSLRYFWTFGKKVYKSHDDDDNPTFGPLGESQPRSR